MNGLGRLKEFSGKEEDFQWSKKTAAFFAGVIKVSEMKVAIHQAFLSTMTSVE